MNHTCKNVTYEKVDDSTILIKGQLSNGNKVKIYININSYGQYSIDYVEVKHIFRTVKLNHLHLQIFGSQCIVLQTMV